MAVLATAWRLVVVATPLLGLWLSSSLIAFFGGPRELTLLGGLLLFPLLPLLWEAWAARRFARRRAAAVAARRDPPQRVLKTLDRLTLRTLLVNGAFLALLFALYPRPAFTALATRGDWFLDGRDDDVSAQVRAGLFAAAGGLEWLHELANPNPYKKAGDDAPVPDDVKPVAEDRPTDPDPVDDQKPVVDDQKPPVQPQDHPEKAPGWLVGDTRWPHEGSIHAAVLAMRPEHETSITAVAQHLIAAEADPFLRVKALHDWTISRLRYDHDSVAGVRKPQDAVSVFNNRLGVCEGYARLMVALGQAAGIPIEYVVGEVREQDGEAAPVGHAWNAVQVQGNWYFLDATWDDPVSDGADAYQTDYLFTPPSVAIFDLGTSACGTGLPRTRCRR
jgi:hypothetical protein